MNYVEIDSQNSEHNRSTTNFLLSGHPHVYLNGKEVDADIEYRAELVKRFELNWNCIVEDSNGSIHALLSHNDNYTECVMLFEFFADNNKNDFAIEVSGKMMYNPKSRRVAFIPEGTPKKVPVSEIY